MLPAPWPGPVDPVRLTSRAYRDERSRALAVWLGLPEDAHEAFAERMELSWTRQQAFESAQAARVLAAAERHRADVESRGELVMLRNRRLTRLRPRKLDPAA